MMMVANAGAVRWSTTPVEERRRILHRVAALMSEERAAAIAVMADEAGKTVHEADPEVSEAVDFARYYSDQAVGLDALLAADGVGMGGRGVVAVIAPWNFPYAIPAGGVFAALAAGNAVILKPAPETPRTAWWLARQLWRAGVPDDVFQYAAIDDGPVGTHLVTHPDVDTVVLTGAYDTAARFFEWKPDRRLLAETSGKNAMVITAAADLDGAIADLVRSAFGHAGQKCSAASLAIVDAPVYDDPEFSDRLRAAVESLVVGPGADPVTMMGPLIRPPDGPLARALTSLERGERWLVEPRQLDTSGTSWSPGVRLGVGDRSWFHQTECFGPVLGVMRADDLEHAIDLQNDVAYGLTGGIQSLDPNEVDRWLDRVQVGNAYVNRHITGAIVQRQPFGGWKRSAVGPGAKAGGPGYVPLFCRFDGPRGATVDERATVVPSLVGDVVCRRTRSDRTRVRAQRPSVPPARPCSAAPRPGDSCRLSRARPFGGGGVRRRPRALVGRRGERRTAHWASARLERGTNRPHATADGRLRRAPARLSRSRYRRGRGAVEPSRPDRARSLGARAGDQRDRPPSRAATVVDRRRPAPNPLGEDERRCASRSSGPRCPPPRAG